MAVGQPASKARERTARLQASLRAGAHPRALPENARRARLLGADASHAVPGASCSVARPRRTSEHRQAGGASFSETLGVAALLADDARKQESSTCSFCFFFSKS